MMKLLSTKFAFIGKKRLTLLCVFILLIPMVFLPFVEFASANYYHYSHPKVTVLSPLTDTVYGESSIALNVKVEMLSVMFPDSEKLGWIKYSLDGQTEVTMTVKNDADNTGSYGYGTGTLSGFSKGAHFLLFSGETTLSNHSASNFTSSVYFIVSSVTPTIQVLSPQQTTYYSTNVTLDYKSDNPLSWAAYSLDKNVAVSAQPKLTLINLSNGPHSLRIYGVDNTGRVYASQSVIFTVDGKKPPTVVIDVNKIVETRKYLPSDFQDKTYWKLYYNVSEPASWVGYSLDGRANDTIEGSPNLSLSYGTHTIIVYAKDICGNAGASAPYTFTLGPNEAGSAYANTSPTPRTSRSLTTLHPSPTNHPSKKSEQEIQLTPISATLIVWSAVLVTIVGFACLFFFKWNQRRKGDL
jgi:hypothetical protein